ncbi:MAG: hypothetical protein H6977_14595 [Gammaproteobacteria bacterium]|nr:hypothetical protein [Gammaproteobacteria bacterium]
MIKPFRSTRTALKSMVRHWPLVIFGLVASCTNGEAAVEQVVLFSGIEGHVLKDGQPVADATLIREWIFAQDRVQASDQTTTDTRGRFSFAPVLHSYRKPRFLPQQPVVAQLIRVLADGHEWEVWAASKHNLNAGTEAVGGPSEGTAPTVPLRVTIDLDSPEELRGKVLGHTLFEDDS